MTCRYLADPSHRCHRNTGEPIREGEVCYAEARASLLVRTSASVDVGAWTNLERERLVVWIAHRRLDRLAIAVSWCYQHDLVRLARLLDRAQTRLIDRIARANLRRRAARASSDLPPFSWEDRR